MLQCTYKTWKINIGFCKSPVNMSYVVMHDITEFMRGGHNIEHSNELCVYSVYAYFGPTCHVCIKENAVRN